MVRMLTRSDVGGPTTVRWSQHGAAAVRRATSIIGLRVGLAIPIVQRLHLPRNPAISRVLGLRHQLQPAANLAEVPGAEFLRDLVNLLGSVDVRLIHVEGVARSVHATR